MEVGGALFWVVELGGKIFWVGEGNQGWKNYLIMPQKNLFSAKTFWYNVTFYQIQTLFKFLKISYLPFEIKAESTNFATNYLFFR